LVTGGALGLVWGLVRANAVGWTSLEVAAALTAGIVLLAAFVLWEARAKRPMLPMHYFRTRAFSAGNASGFLMYGSVAGAAFFMAQFLQNTHHLGPLEAGLRLIPWTVTLFVVAPIAGRLVERVGERRLISGGLILQAAALATIALMATLNLDYGAMVLPLIFAGCGVSLAMPAAQNAVMSSVPRAAIGTASGAFNTLRQLGITFGIAIPAAVFAAVGSYVSPEAFSRGFAAAIGVGAVLSFAGAIIGLSTPGRRGVSRDETAPVQPTLVDRAEPAGGRRPAPVASTASEPLWRQTPSAG
jgi:MFS family permease